MTTALLEGRTALVTGASTGIGQSIAQRLAEAGADVAVHYRKDEAGARETAARIEAAGRRAMLVQADLQHDAEARAAVAEAVAAFGKLEILVNNVGNLVRRVPLYEATDDFFDTVIDTNLKSAFLVSRYAYPYLVAAGERGRIINISSATAYEGGRTGDGIYATAKAGLMALTKAFAKELAPHKVTANVLCPGVVETAMLSATSPEMLAQMIARIPLGLGKPADIAGGAVFLASDAARWMTDAILDMNGGASMP